MTHPAVYSQAQGEMELTPSIPRQVFYSTECSLWPLHSCKVTVFVIAHNRVSVRFVFDHQKTQFLLISLAILS